MSQFIEMFKDTPIVKLEDYISTQSGGTPNTKKHEYYDDGDIPWLSSGEVNQGYIDSTEKFITQAGLDNSSAKWVPKDCVVIAMYGATAGKVGYIRIPLTTNQAVCSLLPSNEFNSIFLYYAVSQKTDWMISQCRGAAQPNISQGIIRSMELPLPSMSEQNKFVAIAEQADKSEFDEFKSQFIEMFKSEDNYEPLENVVVVKDDSRKPINDGVRGSMKEGELYPYYGATGVVDYINDYITDEELLCIAEDCGNYKAGEDSSYIINGKAWVNNHAHLVKAKECCEIKYLHQYLKITDLMPYVSGTTRLKLTQKKMKEIPVLLPSIELQNKFVSIAEQADKSESDILYGITGLTKNIKTIYNGIL